MDLTVIIPTYRNPKYLDLCLKSATENMVQEDTKITVVVDGYPDESKDVIWKYKGIQSLILPHNTGMGNAINMGVWNADTPYVFIVNDDNVFPYEWDKRLSLLNKRIGHNIITIDQIEPSPSIFEFIVKDLGRSTDDFDYKAFLEFEPTVARDTGDEAWYIERGGKIFPFIISKHHYMKVGGFDTFYQSPFWIDVDFWLKLEMAGLSGFVKTQLCHLYHFGSKATKAGSEGDKFREGERAAAQQFMYKWGFLPNIVSNVKRYNAKIPENHPLIRGIQF